MPLWNAESLMAYGLLPDYSTILYGLLNIFILLLRYTLRLQTLLLYCNDVDMYIGQLWMFMYVVIYDIMLLSVQKLRGMLMGLGEKGENRKLQWGENERARMELEGVVSYRVCLQMQEDGLVGFISPLMVSRYTLPRVSEMRIGILILIPQTVHEDMKLLAVLNLILSWHCGETNLSTSA